MLKSNTLIKINNNSELVKSTTNNYTMPRSFLIKRVEKVCTGYFPWNDETLVQGCCSEYRLGSSSEELSNRSEDYDYDDDVIDIESEEDVIFAENEGKNIFNFFLGLI